MTSRLGLSQELSLIMSIYFAQASLANVADEVLAESTLSRPHHRVLVFIGLRPGITVNELLKCLRIRGQSLNPVLSQLIQQGLVTQTTGESDRRTRHLFLTAAGAKVHRQASAPQFQRVREALDRAGPAATEGFFKVIGALIDDEDALFLAADAH